MNEELAREFSLYHRLIPPESWSQEMKEFLEGMGFKSGERWYKWSDDEMSFRVFQCDKIFHFDVRFPELELYKNGRMSLKKSDGNFKTQKELMNAVTVQFYKEKENLERLKEVKHGE